MNKVVKAILTTVVAGFLIVSSLYSSSNGMKNIGEIVNIAGKQRMLSQRIAKDYLYIGAKVTQDKASKELEKSIEEFDKGLKTLSNSISDRDIKNLITFVKMSMEELNDIIKKPFNINNAQLVLDLSESMLEGSQYIVNSLKQKYKLKSVKVVDRAGKQRMLSQRIAKYYIAYQLGIKDKNTIEQTKTAVEHFNENHKFLINYKDNTTAINRELNEVNRLWRIVHKFYLNIEKGGLPIIVYNTTGDITKKMDDITKMYVKIYVEGRK